MSSRGDYKRRDRSWERGDRNRRDSDRGKEPERDRVPPPRDHRRRSRSRSPRRDDRRGDRRDRDREYDRRKDDRRDDHRRGEQPRRDEPRRGDDHRDEPRRADDHRRPREGEMLREDRAAPGSAGGSDSRRDVPNPRTEAVADSKAPVRGSLDPEAPTSAQEEGEAMDEDGGDEEAAMMAAMGLAGFGTTKGKHVVGNQEGAADVKKVRTWRQYMNRRGGFNRPLDKIK